MHNLRPDVARLIASALLFFLSACGSNEGSPPPIGIVEEEPSAPKPADPLPKTLSADVIAQGVPREAAALAFDRYEQWRTSIRNGRYVSVIDFTQHSGRARLFVIDVASAKVDALHVAHATKSDPNDDGLATSFGNVPDSRKTSLGSYLVGEKY